MNRSRWSVSTRRLYALCRKESLQIVRDPSSIVIAFILPVLLLFIFGYGVNLDSSRIRIGLLVEDSGRDAQQFAAALTASHYLEVRPALSRPELADRLARGELRTYVVIPADFSRSLAAGDGVAPAQVVTDGAEPNTASFAASFVQGAWGVFLMQRAAERGQAMPAGVQIVPRYWFNVAAISRHFLVPGSLAVVMTIIGAMLTSLVVAREWERGTMEALLATPVTRTELLLSKVLPYYALGIAAMLLCTGAAVGIMQVPFRGSLLLLLVFTSLFLGSALGLGLLLSTLTRNQFIAAQAALNAAFLPATMLSGFVYDIGSMPPPVRAVSHLIPARYFVSALQTLFQAGFVGSVLLLDAVLLIVSAVFFLGLTALNTHRRLD